MRAELTTARALGEEMVGLAEQLRSPVAAANTRLTLGTTLFSLGELEAARRHAEGVRASARGVPAVAAFGTSSCSLLASIVAHLGLVAQARAMNREALARAAASAAPTFALKRPISRRSSAPSCAT